MATLFNGGVFQAIGSTGLALPGAKLYSYAAGTLDPLATYTTQSGGVSNANPVVCNTAGQANVWLGTAAYRLVLKTSADVTVWDTDNVLPAGVHIRTAAEVAASVTPTDYAYEPGNILRYGADPTGGTSSNAAVASAQAAGYQPYAPRGTYLFNSTIDVTNTGFRGDGPNLTFLRFAGVDAFTLASDEGLNRPATIIEKFSVDGSTSTNCDARYLFKAPGVAASATAVYNSGVTVRDIEVGRTNRFGGGFYLKDVFRFNVSDVGFTNVSWMVRLIGSVVQAKFERITSNNDSAGTTLSRYGFSTESATYDTGTLVPENIRAIDCSYIRGVRGISHAAGLLVEFENFDTEADDYGAHINAPVKLTGGILAPGTGAAAWVGVYRGVAISDPDDATVFEGVDINCLRAPGTPASSYGIDAGDGVSPVYGLIVTECKFRGLANSMVTAIRGRDLRDATITDNFVRTSAISGNDFNLTGRRLFVNRNRVPSGTIVLSDGGEVTAYGEATHNQCSTFTFTPTTANNWNLMFNEPGVPTRRFPHVLTATTTWDPASIADGVDDATLVTCTGAAVGDAAVAGFDIGSRSILLSAHVSAADTVRVMLQNQDGSTHNLASATLRVWVFKS